MQAASDVTDSRLDELEVLGVPEPASELAGDHVGAGPLLEASGQQGAEYGVGAQRVIEPVEVLSSEALQERTRDSELGYLVRRAVVLCCCGNGSVLRIHWRERIG